MSHLRQFFFVFRLEITWAVFDCESNFMTFFRSSSRLLAPLLFAVFASGAVAQTLPGTTLTGLSCPVPADLSGCNANDISAVSFAVTNVVSTCTSLDDTAIADVDVNWSTNSTNYDLSFAFNSAGGAADSGATP